MAWLRVDDGFPEHRKVLELPRKDRWTWVELLCYVARQNNGGHVPFGVTGVIRSVTKSFLCSAVSVGLLDINSDGYAVHDWDVYNPTDPTNSERQRRYRNAKRNGEITDTVTASVTPPARARARGPSPTPINPPTPRSGDEPKRGSTEREKQARRAQAMTEATATAQAWTQPDSDAFAEALDSISHSFAGHEREHLWDIAQANIEATPKGSA